MVVALAMGIPLAIVLLLGAVAVWRRRRAS